MPKYFTDERPLLFPAVRYTPDDLTEKALKELFSKRSSHSICVTFRGFESDCLGFVVHARKGKTQIELLNITGEVELLVNNERELIEVIRHVSGIAYSPQVQRAFQQVRNDIGSGASLSAF